MVTEIEKMHTLSKIGMQIGFHRDMSSKIIICLVITPLTQEPATWIWSESDFYMVIRWGGYIEGVKANEFNWLRFLNRWWIVLHSGCKTGYTHIRLWVPRTQSHITSHGPRSPLRHLRYSGENIKVLPKLAKFCGCMCDCIIIRLGCRVCRNPKRGCAALLISFMDVADCVLPSRLCQFVKFHQLLPISLHVLWYWIGDCAHHPAGIVIFAQLALVCLFIILILPILPIVETYKITPTATDSNHHLLRCLVGHCRCQSRVFSFRCIFLLLLNRCLFVFNSLSCPSSFSRNLIVIPFFCLLITLEVYLSTSLGCKLLLDCKLHNAPWSWILSGSKMPLHSFACWHCCVDQFSHLP